MTDRRRRRQLNSSQELLSEGESQQQCSLSFSESENGLDQDYINLSEFDTAEEDDENTESDNVKRQCEISAVSCIEGEESIIGTEKIDSEPQEKIRNEEPDKDQERKDDNDTSQAFGSPDLNSPFFTPSKGKFYQHDMRSEASRGGGRFGSRNFNREFNKSKWVHDKYDEKEQTSKSKDELVEEYGYDIRAYTYDKRPRSHNPRSRQRRPGRRDSDFSRQKYDQINRFSRSERSNEFRENHRQNSPLRQRNRPSARSQNSLPATSAMTLPTSDRRRPDHNNWDSNLNTKDDVKKKTDLAEAKTSERKTVEHDKSRTHNSATSGNPLPTEKSNMKPEPKSVSSCPTAQPDEKCKAAADETYSILNVIDKWKKGKPHPGLQRDARSSSQRHEYRNTPEEDLISEKTKKLTVSATKETTQPRRYSSLRQRSTDSSANPLLKHLRLPEQWHKNSKEPSTVHNYLTEVNNNVQHEENSFLSRRNVNDIDLFQVSKNLEASYEKSSSEVAQEVVNSLFPSKAYPLLPPIEPEGRASLSDPQHWIDSAIAYRESLIAQSRAILLSAGFCRQQPVPNQLPVPDFLTNNKLRDTGPQMPLTSRPVNQPEIGVPGAPVFPSAVLRNFSPNIFSQSTLSERPIVNHNMRVPFLPNNALIGQDMGGAIRYPNPLQPVQNCLPINTSVGSPISRMDTAMSIRQSMQ